MLLLQVLLLLPHHGLLVLLVLLGNKLGVSLYIEAETRGMAMGKARKDRISIENSSSLAIQRRQDKRDKEEQRFVA